MGSLSQADRQVINGLYNFVLDRNVARANNGTTNATNTTGNITNSTSGNTTNATSGNNTNNGTRPNNQTNNTNNGTRPNNQTNNTNSTGNNSTGNNTNANNTNSNATNNTNNTAPPQVQDVVSVRSGVLSFENDPTDYMVNINNPRNWIHPVRANFTAG